MLALIAAVCGCSRQEDTAKPVATPAVTISQSAAAIGSPVEVTYKFVVAPDAPAFKQDYVVFIHFNDATGDQLWTDDHLPPTPTTQWKPGDTVEYRRTMFVPKVAYTGSTSVDLGLYAPQSGERLPLGGEAVGQRAYRVATFEVMPQVADVVVFKSGWHDPESDRPDDEWHWSKGEGTLLLRKPKQEAMLLLDLDQPVMEVTPAQRVEVRLGGMPVDSFSLPPGRRQLRRIPLSAALLGDAQTVEVTIAPDRTFSPASLSGSRSPDVRTLGVRVFHAYVQPKKG